MSELKEHLFVPYSELQEGDELTDAITIAKSYYLKSEADKMIAEKDKVIALLKERICNGDVSRLTWIDDCIAKDKEIAELKADVNNVLIQNRELCQALQVMYSAEEYTKLQDENTQLKQKLEDMNELIKESKELLKELLKESQKMRKRCADNAIKQLRHHKYKRCLAMAEMCNARYDEADAKENWCGLSWEYVSKEMKYWERWRKRWLELAKKFKEAK